MERTLRLTMEAGDTPTAAELLVRSARRAVQLTLAQSPLQAARDGQLERAVRLADLCAVEDRALWHLLLAGERAEFGQRDEARRIISHLDGGAVPVMHGWRGRLAILLLLEIRELDPEAFQRLVDKMLTYEEIIVSGPDPNPRIEDVTVLLRERGALDAAREAPARWGPHRDWSLAAAFARAGRLAEVDALLSRVKDRRLQEAHLDLATALVEIGALEAARIELGRAIEETEPDSDKTSTYYGQRLRAHQAAIELAASLGEGEATLASVTIPEHQAWGLALAARLTAGSDHARADLLTRAEAIVHGLQPTAERVVALHRIAKECVQTDPARSRRLVTDAVALAGRLSDDDWKQQSSLTNAPKIWSDLARLSAELGDIGLALQLVANIPDDYAFMSEKVIAEIGAMEVRRGDAEGGLACVRDWLKEHARHSAEAERWVGAQALVPWMRTALELGQRVRARDVAATLLVVEANEDAKHVDEACGELVHALLSARRPDDAIAVTDLIHDDSSRNYHRSKVGVALARRGNVTAARQIVGALSSSIDKDPVLRAIGEALATRGDLTSAETVIAEMKSWGSEFTDALAALIAPLARKNGQSAGLDQLSRVRSHSEKTAAAALADMIEATAPQVDLAPLVNFIGTLDQPLARVIGWAALGRGLARIGRREEAFPMFQRATTEAALAEANARREHKQHPHSSPEFERPWRELAIAAHRANFGDVGDEALRKMHGAEAYENDWDDNELELVHAIVGDGLVARAFAAARTMDRFGREASALTAISASGYPLPEGFLEHVEDSWQRRADRESWVVWFAMILGRAGKRQRLIELLDDRPRDLPTALALCGVLGRLDPSCAWELTRAMVAAARSAPPAVGGPDTT
jgi:hypothetical protein